MYLEAHPHPHPTGTQTPPCSMSLYLTPAANKGLLSLCHCSRGAGQPPRVPLGQQVLRPLRNQGGLAEAPLKALLSQRLLCRHKPTVN